MCLGKSTYARCGIIVNVTPLEPEWEGHVTLEFSNTTPLPAKIYANEGVAQMLFFGFAAALDKKDAVVIYDGHSRLGQGPVFGPENVPACPDKTKFPTNPWSDHFRMGWEFASVECLMDILYHGTNPKEYTLPKGDPKAAWGPFASGGLIEVLSDTIKAGGTRTAGTVSAGANCPPVGTGIREAEKYCNGATPLSKRHYWRHFWNSYLKAFDFETFVEVGIATSIKPSWPAAFCI